MPNQLYPDNIYLQGNLRLTEKRTVRDDARINSRGNSRNPGPTQRPNNSIPLKEWIQEQMDNNALNVPCNCESTELFTPQACVTTHFKRLCNNPIHSEVPCPTTGYFSQFYSCSATDLPIGCTKSYKIFGTQNPAAELVSYATIDEINALYSTPWANLPESLSTFGEIYHIIEYITCDNGSSESLPVYFELGVRNISNNPNIKQNVPEVVLVDEDYVDIRDMGLITADDINAESGSDIYINKSKIVYSNEYVEAWYLTIVEPFDIGAISDCELISTLGNLNINNIPLGDDTYKRIQFVTGTITPEIINDCTLHINYDLGGGEINPQNLTTGAIQLKAKVKKYPILWQY